MRKPAYYLITVWRDIEPKTRGPFKTERERNLAAKRYLSRHSEDSVFCLNIARKPVIFKWEE